MKTMGEVIDKIEDETGVRVGMIQRDNPTPIAGKMVTLTVEPDGKGQGQHKLDFADMPDAKPKAKAKPAAA